MSSPDKYKAMRLREQHGIDLFDYKRMLDAQGGGCAICGVKPEEQKARFKKYLPVDHDHRTDRIRGLLCAKCNAGLGHFDDSPARLRSAATYIEAHAIVAVAARNDG